MAQAIDVLSWIVPFVEQNGSPYIALYFGSKFLFVNHETRPFNLISWFNSKAFHMTACETILYKTNPWREVNDILMQTIGPCC